MKLIDDFLNQITMYRLMLYFLTALWILAAILTFFGIFDFNFIQLLISSAILLTACWVTNKTFAKIFNVTANVESIYISTSILILILSPVQLSDFKGYLFLALAGFLAIASKYILFWKRHLFNPAALAVVLTSLMGFGASWWIGTGVMFWPILIGGLLIIKKIKKFSLVSVFLLTTLIANFITNPNGSLLPDAQILFLAFVMLVEPMTSPNTRRLQIVYGILVGLLSAPFHFGGVTLNPEQALLVGNLFSFIVNPKYRSKMTLKKKTEIGPEIYEFEFKSDQKFDYQPGQYMEWTLANPKPDSRGIRRFFTLASSPTEDVLRLGVKMYPNGSTFKQSLKNLPIGSQISANQLSGEFTLPKDQNQKLAFIAGGIGITPFRSMVKYLFDSSQKRDIVLFYSVKNKSEAVFMDVFKQANKLGVKTVLIETESGQNLSEEKIKREAPDFKERNFYLSGPHGMVTSFEKILNGMGVVGTKTDFFPGYA